jgi:hypothetical protein
VFAFAGVLSFGPQLEICSASCVRRGRGSRGAPQETCGCQPVTSPRGGLGWGAGGYLSWRCRWSRSSHCIQGVVYSWTSGGNFGGFSPALWVGGWGSALALLPAPLLGVLWSGSLRGPAVTNSLNKVRATRKVECSARTPTSLDLQCRKPSLRTARNCLKNTLSTDVFLDSSDGRGGNIFAAFCRVAAFVGSMRTSSSCEI